MGHPLTTNQIRLFRSLFKTRTDVYAKFWTNLENSKSGYAPVYNLKTKSALDGSIIQSHLNGRETIGVYPLFPDNTCSFLAIDFDKSSWLENSVSLAEVAQECKIPCYVEKSKSGNGSHVWFFFDQLIPTYKARAWGKILLKKAKLSNNSAYDRMFPSQDEHSGKGFGNLICLPLQGKCASRGTTVFINKAGETYPNQWKLISSIKKVAREQIDALINNEILNIKAPKKTQKVKIRPMSFENEDNSNEEEKGKRKVKTSKSSDVKAILNSQIYIPDILLPDKLYKFLKSELNFPNPEYYKRERLGYSTWQTPRFIKTIEVVEDGILLPIGYWEEIKEFIDQNNLRLTIDDNRKELKPITFSCTLKLKPEQQKVSKELLKHERVILEAKPGFGKTIVGLYCMKRRKQPTLIVVHTKTLLYQWLRRIDKWFNLKEKDVGIIGDNKWKIGAKVTIASYQTLVRRGLEKVKERHGLVIIDECQHVPAKTLSEVVKQLPAKYVIGLTATPCRRDKLEKLMHFYISTKIVQANSQVAFTKKQAPTLPTKLIIKRTNFEVDKSIKSINSDFQEICKLLITDDERNSLIIQDIVNALHLGAKCLVLTERIDHCDTLLEKLKKSAKGIHAAIASGKMTKKNRQRIAQRMKQDRFQLLIATGKLIGEGFDWPELSHLFLAYTFSWKGKLVQYVGRVQRETEGKKEAIVYDYLDYDVPMLKIMYFKRLRTYRSLGLHKGKMAGMGRNKVNENQLGLF
ncbi:DEAD/DEAH box helicase, partial [Patescibacteria group bacterium]|nr:DEAD/DEAH box helicase [Patescibacteria group bacterium]